MAGKSGHLQRKNSWEAGKGVSVVRTFAAPLDSGDMAAAITEVAIEGSQEPVQFRKIGDKLAGDPTCTRGCNLRSRPQNNAGTNHDI